MPKGIPKAGRRNYTSKYVAGQIVQTPVGDVRLIEVWNAAEAAERGFSNARAIVEFVATGYVTNCQLANLTAGKVKDMRRPSVYGVGYLDMDIRIPGRGSEVRDMYDLWSNMLRRCYGGYNQSYIGCSVDKRWLSFRVFMNTVQDVPGYAQWLTDHSYHLDKDLRVPGNRVYSRDTCQFVPARANLSDAADRRWGNK